mmetsp:Transcript_153582/g.286296  ORF Transcript_153582/g.286296 Transcript_153582/m.286296 type:complete len:671 (+) Transcript_153582:76-2088(+)
MKSACCFLGLFLLSAVGAGASEVTPVQKVIQLLEGMLAKGKQEKHDEETQYAAYSQWCDDTSAEKAAAIEAAAEKIEILKADIGKFSADAATLTKEIAGHEEDIAVWTGDQKAATKVREIEKADFDTTNTDYSESVDALQRAIAVLKAESYDRKQAESLAQVSNLKRLNLIPANAKKAIDLFLAQGLEGTAEATVESAPEANAYEFQSGGVVEMLEKLLDMFTEKRTTLQKEEMNAAHAYDMLMADLKAQIASATDDVDSKTSDKASALESKATAEGDLSDTTATKTADEKYKADTDATCAQKASDFEARQQLRAEELVAIEKAIEILSSSSVTGNAEKYLPSALVQNKKPVLAQLRADASKNDNQKRVAQFLQHQAKQLNSRVLSFVAAKAAEDPFTKVKKMIKDLIVRLMEEATDEAEHKGWCDTELANNEQTRQEKTSAVETLNAEIDELTASIAMLGEDIAKLTAAVATLDANMAKATKLREAEKEENTATIKDAQEAQTAVAQALTVLKEFYSKAAEATSLVQKQPAIFDSPYKGMQAENGGVVGMLEVIQSDFARLEADTKTAEAAAQKEYDTFMTDSKVDKSAKTTDIQHKTAKKSDEEGALVSKKSDLEDTQKELDAALAYYDKLKPSCVDAGVSYDDRVARRQEEIESLQEALRILSGDSI